MHFSRLPWILNKLASMREQCTATECCCVFFSLLLPLLFCFGSHHAPVSFTSFALLLMFFFSLIQLLAVFSSFVTQKLLLSQTRRRTRTWNHLGSSNSKAGESTYVTYSFGNHFGGGRVYHGPGASYPGRSLLQRVYPAEQQSGTTHQPCKNKKPAPRQNKTKSLERAASKQASTKSITAK